MVTTIAEIGSNWLGDVELGKRLIKECKNVNASAVKFQMWKAERQFSKSHPFKSLLEGAELTFVKAKELKQFADFLKIEWFCSVYYPEAVDFLESVDVVRYQIDLKAMEDNDLIRKVSQTGKPVYVSLNPEMDIDILNKISEMFSEGQVKVLYALPGAVTKDEELNLRFIDSDIYDGFIDPFPANLPSICAVSRGARIIEKFVCANRSTISPEIDMSITVEDLRTLIGLLNRVEKLMGYHSPTPVGPLDDSPVEEGMETEVKRGVETEDDNTGSNTDGAEDSGVSPSTRPAETVPSPTQSADATHQVNPVLPSDIPISPDSVKPPSQDAKDDGGQDTPQGTPQPGPAGQTRHQNQGSEESSD